VKIPIQNLYYLLCFAWNYAPQDLAMDVGAIPASSDVLELCSYVLATGMDYLFRRGLDQGYLLHEEQTARLRGRIHMTQTVRCRAWSRPQAVCQFDELSPNVLHNQIIRTTAESLMCVPSVNSGLRDRLRTVYVNLAGVSIVPVTDALFRRVQLHRNNSYYAFLMFVCRLVHSLKLPTPVAGEERFRDLLSDEKIMERVFEEFLRNFYRLKQQEFSRVDSAHLKWAVEPIGQSNLDLLPEMRTDVTLRSETRTIIMDAKYYKDALREHYGTKKAHSGNLYQLLAYLRAEAASLPHVKPEGILIYPVGDSEVDQSYLIDGYRVRLYTLNLNQTWQEIERDLLGLLSMDAARPTA
jgi:5-methylcytosine-specific restriction enzyme subunit McrC